MELRQKIHQDLLRLVDTTLADQEVGPKIQKLMEFFRVDADTLKQEVLSYTLDKGVDGYVNDRYRKIASRLTLFFHNIVRGTYHAKRHELVLSFLRQIKANKLMDIGYGVPGPYLLTYLAENPEAIITLADQDQSAEEFARGVFLVENPELLERVDFRTYDMNTEDYPGDAEVYIYLDSIEHTKRPTEYLHKMVKEVKTGSYFIFSIPICPMTGLEGFHFAEWLTDDDAREWVQDAGLKIMGERAAHPNPEVDYFAELVEGGYHNYLVLGQK